MTEPRIIRRWSRRIVGAALAAGCSFATARGIRVWRFGDPWPRLVAG